MTFVDVWVAYAIFGAKLFSAMFVWAVRARQFSDMDRGRHIPLTAARKIVQTDDSGRRPAAVDRYTWVLLALLTLAALIAALLMGLEAKPWSW